jgi:hypothetical protein
VHRNIAARNSGMKVGALVNRDIETLGVLTVVSHDTCVSPPFDEKASLARNSSMNSRTTDESCLNQAPSFEGLPKIEDLGLVGNAEFRGNLVQPVILRMTFSLGQLIQANKEKLSQLGICHDHLLDSSAANP